MGDLGHVLDAPSGTTEVVELLDRLGVPIEASASVAMGALKDAGAGRRKQAVLAAMRIRRELSSLVAPQVTAPAGTAGNRSGATTAPMVPDDGGWLSRIGEQLLEKDRDRRLPWHNDPVGFARECISWPAGTGLAPYQASILQGVVDHRRLAVRSLHGVGKTTTAALFLLWHAVTRDAAAVDFKTISTAGSWRQLEKFLWPEIHLWARRLRFDLLGREPFNERDELMNLTLHLRHGSAFAVASTDSGLIEGAHGESIAYLYDEAKSIPSGVFDATEGAFAGAEAFALAMSTPGEPAGRFYEFFAKRPGLEDWSTQHVSLEQGIAAGRVSAEWAQARAKQWGEGSALYLNRVRGEFCANDQDGVIPLSWVELANERWRALQDAGVDFGPVTHLGVDVGRGRDKTVLALRHGDVISETRSNQSSDLMESTGYVAAVLGANPGAQCTVDVVGIGAGVCDRLREQGFKPQAFNGSSGTDRRDRSGELQFLNLRAASWWYLREQLDPAYGATLALPEDDELMADLIAPHYQMSSSGKLQIENKDAIQARLGRSPDRGDAVVLAVFDAARGIGHAFMDWMLAKKAAQDVAPPTPDQPSQMVQLQAAVLGGFAPVARRCSPGQHRYQREYNNVCALCGRTPEEVV